jgi:hypothetical protein
LGHALKTGALSTNPAEVAGELLFVKAMAEFEEPHLSVLERLGPKPDKPNELPYVTTAELARLPGIGSATAPMLATFQARGAVEQYRMDPEAIQRSDVRRSEPADGSWHLTDFGWDCLLRLRAAAPPNSTDVSPGEGVLDGAK